MSNLVDYAKDYCQGILGIPSASRDVGPRLLGVNS